MTGTGDHARRAAVSTGYLCLIENGRKVPNEPVARAIAEALGDDPALYAAWVAARKRSDLPTALAAARLLGEALAWPRPAAPAAPTPPASSVSGTRLRVPVIREGDDPGEGLRPVCPVTGWHRLDLGRVADADRERLDRPVAWRGDDGARHAPDRFAGMNGALLLRRFLPLERDALYAVRFRGRVVTRRVVWNERQLLLLPAPDAADFDLLEAHGEHRLRVRILGRVAPIVLEEPAG